MEVNGPATTPPAGGDENEGEDITTQTASGGGDAMNNPSNKSADRLKNKPVSATDFAGVRVGGEKEESFKGFTIFEMNNLLPEPTEHFA